MSATHYHVVTVDRGGAPGHTVRWGLGRSGSALKLATAARRWQGIADAAVIGPCRCDTPDTAPAGRGAA